MFSFNNAYIPITLQEIKLKVTDYDIFRRYCCNFKEIDKPFLSEFYQDTKASCRVLVSSTGSLYYKDFGLSYDNYFSAFNYVKFKYNCLSIDEVINIIANDFGLRKAEIKMDPKILIANNLEIEKPVYTKQKTNIVIAKQTFSLIDANYWNSYGVSLNTLIKFNVFSCSHVFIEKANKYYTVQYNKSNPLYAYKFNDLYKIYRPLGKKEEKWLSNVGSDVLQGYDQLPDRGDLLIITKSMKDVLAYHELGYSAVALQAETNNLPENIYKIFIMRFKRLMVNFDNDEEGIRASNKLFNQFEIPFFFIGDTKDLSDLIKLKGLNYAKEYVRRYVSMKTPK